MHLHSARQPKLPWGTPRGLRSVLQPASAGHIGQLSDPYPHVPEDFSWAPLLAGSSLEDIHRLLGILATVEQPRVETAPPAAAGVAGPTSVATAQTTAEAREAVPAGTAKAVPLAGRRWVLAAVDQVVVAASPVAA